MTTFAVVNYPRQDDRRFQTIGERIKSMRMVSSRLKEYDLERVVMVLPTTESRNYGELLIKSLNYQKRQEGGASSPLKSPAKIVEAGEAEIFRCALDHGRPEIGLVVLVVSQEAAGQMADSMSKELKRSRRLNSAAGMPTLYII